VHGCRPRGGRHDREHTDRSRLDPRSGRAQGRPGKEHFRESRYGLAELHFRRAVESRKGDAEAWLGLAASYDRLKRFRLADRAYAQALKISGPTAELLNNRGYSYLLRGDIRRASQDLSAALALDPENERIRNNVKTLEVRARGRA
jgi:Flp pilus assembly protein TadD